MTNGSRSRFICRGCGWTYSYRMGGHSASAGRSFCTENCQARYRRLDSELRAYLDARIGDGGPVIKEMELKLPYDCRNPLYRVASERPRMLA